MNQSLKLVKETKGHFNFDAPYNAGISKIQKLAVTEVPSIFEIRSSAAFNVPPVANRSSTINTFAPAGRLSFYISQTSLLYSVPYSCLWHSPGSFPALRIGTKGRPHFYAKRGP